MAWLSKHVLPWVALVCWAGGLAASEARAQTSSPPKHRLYRLESSPPGAIGLQQLARPEMRGYVQPVQLFGPAGSLVSVALGEAFSPPQAESLKAGLTVGGVYRFKIGAVPRLEETEVFPTIELIGRLHPPAGLETRFPIPIQVTREEIEAAAAGRLVTRIVYVEDPRNAIPVAQDRREQPYVEARTFEDPLEVADRLGRPVAILRMGSRVPDVQELQRLAASAPTPVLYGPEGEWEQPLPDETTPLPVEPREALFRGTAPAPAAIPATHAEGTRSQGGGAVPARGGARASLR